MMHRCLWQKEWMLIRRNGALWLTIFCYLILLGWGSYNSVLHTRLTQQRIQAAQQDETERWQRIETSLAKLRANPGEKPLFGDVRSPSYVGGFDGPRYAILPVRELAALSAGEALPQQVLITTFSRYESGREEIDNPVNAVAGGFDLLFVVIFVLPLALIALTYNLISAEREAGTWALLLSLGIAPRAFALVKCAWRGGLLLVPTWLAGALTCALSNGFAFTSGGCGRLILWMIAVGAYTALWLGLAVWINARCVHSSQNILWLVTLWVLLTLLLPGLTHLLAMKLHPPAHHFEMALQARDLNVEREKKLSAMYEWYYAQHPEDRPAPELIAAANKPVPGGSRSSDSRRTFIPSLYLDEQLRPLLEQRSLQRQARKRVVQWCSLLSPALALQLLSDQLAGTDADRFAQFEQTVNQAQHQWRAFFGPHIMRLNKLTAQDYARIPRFDQQPEQRVPLGASVLAVLLAAAFIINVAASQRLRG